MASSATTSTETGPRLRRTLTLWDLILYGVIVIQPVAPMSVFGVLSARECWVGGRHGSGDSHLLRGCSPLHFRKLARRRCVLHSPFLRSSDVGYKVGPGRNILGGVDLHRF